jgi:hypothetical protein
MGVYSNNRTQLGMYDSNEVFTNESYGHQTGLLEMLVDNIKNDQAIFEAVITNDFREAAGLLTESADIINEAGNFIDKVKEFLRNCWEKVKGIFKSFIVKINNVIIRDNKEFVNKYKRDVLSKDLTKMKYKWAEPTDEFFGAKGGEVVDVDEVKRRTKDRFNRATLTDSKEELEKTEDDINSGALLEEFLENDPDTYVKDFHEACFNDVEIKEGLNTSDLSEIMNMLVNSSKALKGIKTCETACNNFFNDMFRTVDRNKKKLLNLSTAGDKVIPLVLKRQNIGYKIIQVSQTANTKIINAIMRETKYHIAQCRRVFAQAAAYNPRSVITNASLIEAVGEAAEYEIMSSFEDYEE